MYLRYPYYSINTHYVCFACRLQIRRSKYSDGPPPRCPECGAFTNDIGSRYRTVPPRLKTALWRDLENEFRQCQRAIAEYYRHWHRRLTLDTQNHLRRAEALELADITEQDRRLLTLLARLPEIPWAAEHPFNWHWQFDLSAPVSHSDINNPKAPINEEIRRLEALPYNRDRQRTLAEKYHAKNRLQVSDPLCVLTLPLRKAAGLDW